MANGHFAGGLAEGLALSERLSQADRELDLREGQLNLERQTGMIERVQGAIGGTLKLAAQTIAAADQKGVSRDDPKLASTIASLRDDAVNTALLARNNNLPVDPAMTARQFDALLQSPTPVELATSEARNKVEAARTVARETGVPEREAFQGAGLVPAERDQFRFMTPAEQAQAGFPQNAIVQINDATGQAQVLSDGGDLSRGDSIKIEQDLRRDFDKQSADFEEAQANFLAMNKWAKDSTGASDVALVFSFFKTIDPSSTVREGEFASAAQAAGLPAQLIQSFARLDSGEILPAQLRQDLVSAAGEFFNQRLTDQREREAFYRGLAERAGAEPGNVVRSRIRFNDTGRFAAMTIEQLNAVDIDSLSDAELKQFDKELRRRGL